MCTVMSISIQAIKCEQENSAEQCWVLLLQMQDVQQWAMQAGERGGTIDSRCNSTRLHVT